MTDSISQAIEYAIHDRAGSWHGRHAPAERLTEGFVRSALVDRQRWQEVLASEVAVHRSIRAPNGKYYGITYLPLASFALRYWVVMQMAEHIDSLWTVRIGSERLSSRGRKSLFLGRTKANARVHLAWMKSQNTKYLMKVDIESFFGSISHDTLCGVLESALGPVTSSGLQMAADLLPPLLCYRFRLEESEEVFKCTCGLPIGNTTERFFSNAYLAEIDDFLLSQPGVHFCRKLDDIKVYGDDREQLEDLRNELITRLKMIGLRLNRLKSKLIDRGKPR